MEMQVLPGLMLGAFHRWYWLVFVILFGGMIFYHYKASKKLAGKMVHANNRNLLVHDLSSNKKLWLKSLLFLSFLLISVGLLEPKWGFHWEEVKREGVDVIVAIDVSKSMLAEDLKPNRLEQAKRKVIDLMGLLQGDRIGLIAFAGTSFLQCPLTLDYGAFRMFLDLLGPELIPQSGTAIDEAIYQAIDAFEASGKKSRAMILITDGEEHSGTYVEAAKKAAEKGIKIFAIGFGSQEGHPIPDPQNNGRHMRDSSGNIVISKLNETILQQIALETKGAYVRALTSDQDLKKIYLGEIQGMEKNELQSTRRKRYENRFQYFLLLGFILLLGEMLIRFNWLNRTVRTGALVLGFFLVNQSYAAEVSQYFGMASKTEKKVNEAKAAYSQEKYADAIKSYTDVEIDLPKNHKNFFNLGAAHYKAGDFSKALEYFSKSVENEKIAVDSNYNLGNTLFRLGKYDQSIKAYESVLAQAPKHEKAKKNLEYVRKKLKEHINKNKDCQNCKNPKNDQKNKEQQSKNQKNKQNQNQNQQNQQKQQQQKQQEQNKKDKEKQKGQQQNKKDQEKKQKQEPQNKKDEQEQQKDGGNQKQSVPIQKLSKEEAQKFLNRLSKENKQHMKEMIRQRMLKRGIKDTGKQW
jgi:Ca-activated chloride channel family protein